MIVVVVYVMYYFSSSASFHLECKNSEVDGKRYCVRKRENVVDAINLLALVGQKCQSMTDFMIAKHPMDERCIRLKSRFQPNKIIETLPTDELTAYSENKGEKIAFCLNQSNGNNNDLIDLNTLTFVAFHELSHLMTESIGHKQDFWENFKFLLQNAVDAGLYEPEDYKKNPKQYCSMTISDNPLFDL